MGKPAAKKTTSPNAVSAAGVFGSALFDIGWRLGIVVIGGLWLGSRVDARYGTKPWGVGIAFLIIIASFVLIVRQILQRIPKEYGGLKHD
jgi:F0F1-type ATP synthase assembly protein I